MPPGTLHGCGVSGSENFNILIGNKTKKNSEMEIYTEF